jgi:four helix bundle protein
MLEDFRTFNLAAELYQQCKSLRVPIFLKDQVLRASASVALNLAEGSGKLSAKDQIRYYSIAFGSLREVQAILALEKVQRPELKALIDQLGALLFKLCRIKTETPHQTDLQTEQTPN